jgi:hypothetical protein
MAAINNFIVDYNKSSQIETVENSNLESVNSFTRKMKFYNPKINEPLHKFWYFIPNAKLTKKTKGIVSIVLSSADTNLIKSIKSLDDKVDQILRSNNVKYSPEPSIKESQNYPPVLELCVDNDSVCYDQGNNTVNFMKITNGSKILLYIELESVMIGSTKCTRNWRVMQMKETKSIDLSTNLFAQPTFDPQQFPSPLPGYPYQPISHMHPIPPNMLPHTQPIQHMQHNPYAQYPGYYPQTDYPQMQLPPGRIPQPPSSRGGRIPPPPPINQHNKSKEKQSEQKKSGPSEGSVYQPPTEDQLLNMIGKLKKATKHDNNIPITPKSNDSLQIEPSLPIPPLIKKNHSIEDTGMVSTKDILTSNNIPDNPQCQNKENTNTIDDNEKEELSHLIKTTIDEQLLIAKRHRKRFDTDYKKITDIMAKIENIIESNTKEQQLLNDTISDTEQMNNNENKIDQYDSDEEDPFMIVK